MFAVDDVVAVRYTDPLPRGPKGQLQVGDLVEVSSIPSNAGTPYQFLILQRLGTGAT